MSSPAADLSHLNEFDNPDVVAAAFRRFRWTVAGLLVLVAVAAAFAGYSVDRTRTSDMKELLHRADSLQSTAPPDDQLAYFSMHSDLAAAAGVKSCSAFALRMTERFLPEGWAFNADDVAAVNRGEHVSHVRLDAGLEVPVKWSCPS